MSDPEIERIVAIFELRKSRSEAEDDLDRRAWLQAARLTFAPGDRQPCLVCGKFQSIAQAHHVVPLATQYDRGFRYPDHEHEWLCPNHHVMLHIFIPSDDQSPAAAAFRARGRTGSKLHPDLSEGEFNKIFELVHRSARGPE